MLIYRIQNKLAWALLTIVTLVLVAALAGVVRGGPLDPPGPVGPTGKTVVTSLPYTISQPGSYVLNGNLSCSGCGGFVSGITVNADNVTVDLQGFELVGGPNAGYGINAPGRHNLKGRERDHPKLAERGHLGPRRWLERGH